MICQAPKRPGGRWWTPGRGPVREAGRDGRLDHGEIMRPAAADCSELVHRVFPCDQLRDVRLLVHARRVDTVCLVCAGATPVLSRLSSSRVRRGMIQFARRSNDRRSCDASAIGWSHARIGRQLSDRAHRCQTDPLANCRITSTAHSRIARSGWRHHPTTLCNRCAIGTAISESSNPHSLAPSPRVRAWAVSVRRPRQTPATRDGRRPKTLTKSVVAPSIRRSRTRMFTSARLRARLPGLSWAGVVVVPHQPANVQDDATMLLAL